MPIDDISAIVLGGLGTDIFALGLDRLIGPGELAFGGRLHVGAGGKSRNMAHMISVLLGEGKVAMVSKTSRDPLNFWRVPFDALQHAGVNLEYTKVVPFEESGKFPQVALIGVDRQGNNQIFVVPGISEDFSAEDVREAEPLFHAARRNNGMLVLSFELPLGTALAAVKLAGKFNLKVIMDPGGIQPGADPDEILQQEIFLLKPNEHETFLLTGITVGSRGDAERAAAKLLDRKISNVLITLGGKGAYLINKNVSVHIPAPVLDLGDARDETGCGDQTMAVLCYSLLQGRDLLTSARQAVFAGTLQFHRAGIVPVSKSELDSKLIV